jgi:hypothetical protein
MPHRGRFGPDFGNSLSFPVRSRRPFGIPSDLRNNYESLTFGNAFRTWREHIFEFDTGAGTTFTLPVAQRVVGTTPAIATRADIANGVARGTLAATSEAETVGADWADQRMVPANSGWIFEAGIYLPANLAANETLIVGMGSDFNATFDSVTLNAWFRITGGTTPIGRTLIIQTDDNVADRSTTTTFVLTVATLYRFGIDATNIGEIRFLVDDAEIGTLAAAAFDTTTLQPMFYVAKASGTTTPSADIDYWYVGFNRK